MPVSGKGGAGFRQSRESKPLPRLNPVRNRRNIHAGGNGQSGGGGVCFRKGKG